MVVDLVETKVVDLVGMRVDQLADMTAGRLEYK